MLKISEALYEALKENSDLLNMLAENTPFYDSSGEASTENSIVPADIVETPIDCPFLVIQEGNETRIGYILTNDTIFIRCYNSRDKSYVEINQILDEVKKTLHRSEIALDAKVRVSIEWETTLPGLVDEPLGLKFKESRYSILVL